MGLNVAVVAAGAMGTAVGARLLAHGAEVMTALAGRSEATIRRAKAAGLQPASDDALAGADIVLSIVPPDQALPLASWFGQQIRRVGAAPIYVDLNAVSPATARQIAHSLAGSGARFIDGSIIGFPPQPGGAGPSFYLSGPGADAASVLGEYGLSIKILPGDVGAASALKMSYAGLTKGFLALGTAMILAAQREGAADALAAELASSQPEMLARLTRGIPDMLPKAYRWVPEMQEIAWFIGPDDPASAIYAAIGRVYEQVAADQDANERLGSALKRFFRAPG